MMLVAGPVLLASATRCTGTFLPNQVLSDVYHSVTRPIRTPAMVPDTIAINDPKVPKALQRKKLATRKRSAAKIVE